MPRPGSLRASDADREQVVQRLHAATTEGRLSAEELDDRVHRALTALTYSDLDAVLTDLPRQAAARRRAGPTPAHRRTVGAWALAAVRANPLLLFVIIPIVATAGAMLLAAAVTWLTLLAVVMILTGSRHRRPIHGRHGPWSLMWGADDRF